MNIVIHTDDRGVRAGLLRLAAEVRQRGTPCEVYLNPGDKIGKQLAYADRLGIPFALILGPDELASGAVTIKSLKDPPPNQQTIPREEAIRLLTKGEHTR